MCLTTGRTLWSKGTSTLNQLEIDLTHAWYSDKDWVFNCSDCRRSLHMLIQDRIIAQYQVQSFWQQPRLPQQGISCLYTAYMFLIRQNPNRLRNLFPARPGMMVPMPWWRLAERTLLQPAQFHLHGAVRSLQNAHRQRDRSQSHMSQTIVRQRGRPYYTLLRLNKRQHQPQKYRQLRAQFGKHKA